MADQEAAGPPQKPTLQKPPAYRHPQSAPPRPPPARKTPLPSTFRQAGKPSIHRRRRRRSLCCRLLLCLFLLIFTLFFLIFIAGAAAYLYFQPHLPYFRLQTLQVPRFNVTTRSDGSGTFLDADVVAKIFASNQLNSKIGVSYSETEGSLYLADADGDVSVGVGSMRGFEQGRRNATVMRFEGRAKGVLLVDDVVGERLRKGFQSKGLKVGVEVRTRVGLRVGGKETGRVPVRVDCSPLSLKQVKGSRLLLPKCDIYLFKWINLH